MRQLLFSALLSVLTLGLLNCKKSTSDALTPSDATCKLTVLDRGNGNKHTYAYNADGMVSKMTINFRGATAGYPEEVYVYTFSYNTAKQITGATITINGVTTTKLTDWGVGDAVSFTWTNGRLTKVDDKLAGKVMLSTAVTYDAQGRVVRLLGTPDAEWGLPFEKTFTYDAKGNFRYTFLEKGQPIYAEDITVDNTVKNAEVLLIAHGLPYDIFNTTAWREHITRQIKGYQIDSTGKETLSRNLQATNTMTNSHTIATSQTFEEGGKQRVTTTTLADCT